MVLFFFTGAFGIVIGFGCTADTEEPEDEGPQSQFPPQLQEDPHPHPDF